MQQKEIKYIVYENSTPGGFVLTEGKMVIPGRIDAQKHVQAMFPGRGVVVALEKYIN